MKSRISKKNERNWGQSQRPLAQYQMYQHLNYRGPRRRRRKERAWENFWKIIVGKFLQHRKGNSQSSPRDTKSPIQDKLKEKHTKTLNKLTKTKYKERILKAAREKQQVTDKANPICLTADLSVKLCRPEGNGRIYLKYRTGKIYNKDYCNQQVSYSKLMEK